MSILTPGIYRLIRDVENPHPDRRSTNLSDWRNRVRWPAGKLFAVCPAFQSDIALELSSVSNYSTVRLLFRTDGKPIDRLSKDLPRVQALAEAMTEVAIDSPYLVLLHNERVLGGVGSAGDVLDTLFAAGKLSLDDVRAALLHCGREDAREHSTSGETA